MDELSSNSCSHSKNWLKPKHHTNLSPSSILSLTDSFLSPLPCLLPCNLALEHLPLPSPYPYRLPRCSRSLPPSARTPSAARRYAPLTLYFFFFSLCFFRSRFAIDAAFLRMKNSILLDCFSVIESIFS